MELAPTANERAGDGGGRAESNVDEESCMILNFAGPKMISVNGEESNTLNREFTGSGFTDNEDSEIMDSQYSDIGDGEDSHWGQGYPETSRNILGTFQGLGQFYCTVTNRHIYGTFEMCC